MNISLCVIARNEADCIEGMLQSAVDYVDEIVVTDTGSTDGTIEIARKYTDKIFSRPWDDSFAGARNFCADHATGDWLLVVDCDERLADTGWQKLRRFLTAMPEEALVVHVTMNMCHDGGKPYQRFLAERIYRSGVRFRGDMHNWLDVQGNQRVAAREFHIFHRRDSKSENSRQSRSIQRVEHADKVFLPKIESDPKDRRSLFYLAGTYYDAQRYGDAVKYLTRYLEVSDWQEERYQGSLLCGDALRRLAQYDRARKVVSTHIVDGPDRAEAYVLLGNIALEQANPTEALEWFDLAKTKKEPASPMFVDVESYSFAPYVGSWKALCTLGRIDEAGEQARLAYERDAAPESGVLKWAKNHTRRNDGRIACFVDRGQSNFLDPLIRDWRARGKAVRTSDREDIELYQWADIIWCEWGGPLAEWVTKLPHRCKVVVRVHGYEAHYGLVGKVNWEHVDSAIFVADYLLPLAARQVGHIGQICNCHVVPGGVTVKPHSAEKTRNSIGMLGFVNERKNLPLALQILAKCPEHTLHIAGQWQSEEIKLYTEWMAHELGITDRVKIEGFVEDKDSWFADKEFVLSTSVRETTHYAVAEGMAAGCKPVVHDWLSAYDLYPSEYVFRTVDEAVDLLQDAGESSQYVEYAARMLDIGTNIARVNRILERPFVCVSGEATTPFAVEQKLLLALERLGCSTDAPNPYLTITTGKTPRVNPRFASGLNALWHLEQVVGEDEHARLRREQVAPDISRFDAVFTLNPNAVEWFKEQGAKEVYCLPCVFSSDPFGRLGSEKKVDVGFCGVMNARREKILKDLGGKFDVGVFENYDHDQVNVFYNQCKIVVNLHYTDEPDLEMRIGEALSAGACVVSEPLPAEVPGVTQTDRLAETIQTLLDNDALRSDLADQGYYWIHREARLDQLVERILTWAEARKGQTQ